MNVPDREALIVDGDDDEDNDCEQADMVQILLNLAYIPQDVIASFKFGPGFNKTFLPHMKKWHGKAELKKSLRASQVSLENNTD